MPETRLANARKLLPADYQFIPPVAKVSFVVERALADRARVNVSPLWARSIEEYQRDREALQSAGYTYDLFTDTWGPTTPAVAE